MNNTTYKQSPSIHLKVWAVIVLIVLLIVNRLPRLSPEMQIVGTVLLTILAIGLLWLYIKSGVLWFSITEDGLIMKRPFWEKLVPWDDIESITWKKSLRTIRVRGDKKTHFFVSTDAFSQLGEFLNRINQHSQCSVQYR